MKIQSFVNMSHSDNQLDLRTHTLLESVILSALNNAHKLVDQEKSRMKKACISESTALYMYESNVSRIGQAYDSLRRVRTIS